MNVLKQLEIYNERIEQSKNQYDDTYSRLTSVTHSMTQTRITASSDPHSFDQIAIDRHNLEEAKRRWLELQRCVLKWMHDCPELSSLERVFILLRYFGGSSNEKIADSLDCSLTEIKRIEKKILALIPDTDALRARYIQ